MSTGLFINRSGSGASLWHAQKRMQREAEGCLKLSAFAEALSEHGNTTLASKAVGCGPAYGRVLLQRLRADLGWQAR